MATSRRVRPPATFRFEPAIAPQPTQVFAPIAVHGFTYHTQYVVNINPVKTPPKVDIPSLRQPVSVAGWGRSVRTHMGAPMLQRGSMGRVAHVGHMVGHTSERGHMRGVFSRGFTYVQPAPSVGPGKGRTQPIGGR